MNSRFLLMPTLIAILFSPLAQAMDAALESRLHASGYWVTTMPDSSGSFSRGNSINSLGWVAGFANNAGDQTRHAALWLYGWMFKLGTLGGPNSNIPWPIKNNRGLLAGIAQTDELEPLGQNWSCSAFFPPASATGYICSAVAWQNGQIRELPTLGGYNGFATGANHHGQIVGWTENAIADPACTPPQVLQFKPVVWGPGAQQLQELPLIAGDTSGAATAINDRGQVVGISGICDQAIGRLTAIHAVLWENGTVIDIGNLGGPAWNTPMAINQRGEVVGFASRAGDTPEAPNLRAFHWSRQQGISDLGVLDDDSSSQAAGINNRGDVVGVSCTATACRAFVRRDGVMSDLNALIQPGFDGVLASAQDINDLGMITGRAFFPASGASKPFVAIPVPGLHGGDQSRQFDPSGLVMPEAVLRDLLHPMSRSP